MAKLLKRCGLLPWILGAILIFALGSLVDAQIEESATEFGTLSRARGFFAVGMNGNAIMQRIDSGTVSIDPASIATVTRGAPTFTLTGASTNDIVIVVPPNDLNDDLLFVGSRVTAANTVSVYLYNPTGGAIDDTAKTWSYLWIDIF